MIWEKLVDQLGRDDLPVVVVANKIDIRNDAKKQGESMQTDYVTREEGIKMLGSIVSSDKKARAGFIESSAKQDINVNEAIMMLLKKMESMESGTNYDDHDNKCIIV